ncbi:MAG: hypothetical protein KIT73_20915, partial [Burkholderiales bacterium]|nr:hypothetical protein [Burkholderiales bacterium]
MTTDRDGVDLPDDAAAVRRAYATASAAVQPPPELDAAILAASRRAVNARPQPVRRSWARRFAVPLSMAAVVLMSATMTLTVLREGPHDHRIDIADVPSSGSPMPPPAPNGVASAETERRHVVPAEPATTAKAAPGAAAAPQRRERARAELEFGIAPAPPETAVATAPPPKAAAEMESAPQAGRHEEAPAMAAERMPAPASVMARSKLSDREAKQDATSAADSATDVESAPATWLDRLHRQWNAGRRAEAAS